MRQLPSYNLEKLKILVVDDNKNMRRIVRQVLHSLGIKEVREADDGADAFKTLKTFAADIIIADWLMSPFDGLEFTHMVRTDKDSPNPQVPIIMLTGHTEIRRVAEARDAGINEFLAKPISAKNLYLRIANVIDKPRPFIESPNYTGPCRHRHNDKDYKGQRRRSTDLVDRRSGPDEPLTEEEVQNLLKG